MELNEVHKWINNYISGLNIDSIDWVILDNLELQKFYDENYLDKTNWKYVTDDLLFKKPIGMHYLSFDTDTPNIKFFLGICNNIIGKKTIVACIAYTDNYKLFKDQSIPITYLYTCEVNRHFRKRNISKKMFDEFAKVVNTNQHVIVSSQSEFGKSCHTHKNLYDSLINNDFNKNITLKDSTTFLYTQEYYDLFCGNQLQLKKK